MPEKLSQSLSYSKTALSGIAITAVILLWLGSILTPCPGHGEPLPTSGQVLENGGNSEQINQTDTKEQGVLGQDAPSEQAEKTAASAESVQEKAASDTSSQKDKVQLFGTVEFKRPLSSLPAWLDLLKRNTQNSIFIPNKVFKRDITWSSFKSKAPRPNIELLRYVNAFWNTWPYKEDIINWHQQDYWAIPAEFLKKSGDCEDYSIIKYFTLKELGIPPENMRIVVVRDTVRNLAHAVLAVYFDGDAYILDNLSNAVLSQSRLRQYMPQYSVNEFSRWAHLKGRKIR